MLYESTRNDEIHINSMDAIRMGISKEGGLFVPESIPKISLKLLSSLEPLGFKERAIVILGLYLTDYKSSDIEQCVLSAYRNGKFSSPDITPVVELGVGLHILELWHGPTCAFKDIALQILPYLVSTAQSNTVNKKDILILTATSGDTGKAALEGFKDVPGTAIMVFYPRDGVSNMQKLQMVTQEGENVKVIAVEGNFDDAQTGVKKIFNDKDVNETLYMSGIELSSANSINWGRLAPQIIYYFSAYLDLVKKGSIKLSEQINVIVPTGNFGNILAAFYAKRMGLPINRIICASNENNVLTDFINTGIYNSNRSFHKTISPSMDILISSNLERLLFELTDHDTVRINEWMSSLMHKGQYQIDKKTLDRVQEIFWCDYATEAETKTAIKDTYKSHGYILDPHTAVGKWVYDKYREKEKDRTETVLVSTASPFKFPHAVLSALDPNTIIDYDENKMLDSLAQFSCQPIPKPLLGLTNKEVIYSNSCKKVDMKNQVLAYSRSLRERE